ncbi:MULTISPECIES: hypothetical protein [Robertmurraya]|nr:hypothetical protein [Robertmurraya siralis]
METWNFTQYDHRFVKKDSIRYIVYNGKVGDLGHIMIDFASSA